jgi:plasmid maintenance system antidote protein VapI
MAYSQKIIDMVASSPKTPGNQLGRWAIHLNFPVTKIAYALGVTRQTVYNWFEGKDVFVAYQNRVDLLVKIMSTSNTADEAWRKICREYNLEA